MSENKSYDPFGSRWSDHPSSADFQLRDEPELHYGLTATETLKKEIEESVLAKVSKRETDLLEQQAKLQKRSLKNYIEFTLEDTALRFSEPTEAYKKMMDTMIKKDDEGALKTYTWEEIKAQYGR